MIYKLVDRLQRKLDPVYRRQMEEKEKRIRRRQHLFYKYWSGQPDGEPMTYEEYTRLVNEDES